MTKEQNPNYADWVEALENLLLFEGEQETKEVLNAFISHARNKNLLGNTFDVLPFENSINK